jgi:hypothetical protein
MIPITTNPRPPGAWLVTYTPLPIKFPRDVPRWPRGWDQVVGIFPSPRDRGLFACLKGWLRDNDPLPIQVRKDKPSLKVIHSGISIGNPACLTAREHWFQRFADVLHPHLRDPLPTQVFTYFPGKLRDPLQTHKSTARGPFPFPKGARWPTCGACGKRLGFVGVLDFRRLSAANLPGSSLVYHACTACGVGPEEETYTLTWLKEGQDLQFLGGELCRPVQVGTRWETTDFPTPFYHADEATDRGPFLQERHIYDNFSCFADKVGGHIFWIQGNETPRDARGRPMQFIGQFQGTDDVSIHDGLAYVFYSPRTAETRLVIQYT